MAVEAQTRLIGWLGRRTGARLLRADAGPTATDLLLDVMYVVAFSRIGAALIADPSLQTAVRGVAILLFISTPWMAIAALASFMSAEHRAFRPVMLTGTVALVMVAITVPDMMSDRSSTGATIFAGTEIVLLMAAGASVWLGFSAFPPHRLLAGNAAVTSAEWVVCAPLLLGAVATTGIVRTLLLVGTAVATIGMTMIQTVDYRGRLPFGASEVMYPSAPGVFTDRLAALVVVALGVVIELAAGLGRADLFTVPVLAYVLVCAALVVMLWWLHFGFLTGRARVMFRNKQGSGARGVALGVYWQGHFLMVVALVLVIVGMGRVYREVTAAMVWQPVTTPVIIALIYGGLALFLLAQSWFWSVMAERRCRLRPAAAGLLVVLVPVGAYSPLLVALSLPVLVAAGLVVADNRHCRIRVAAGGTAAATHPTSVPGPRSGVLEPTGRGRTLQRLPWRLRVLGRYCTARARVTELELLVDVVAGFAITQTAYLFDKNPSPAGAAQSLLVLVLLWGCWSATMRLANVVKADLGIARIALLATLVAMLLLTLAAPDVFTTTPATRIGGATLVLATAYLAIMTLTAAAIRLTLPVARTTTAVLALLPAATTALILGQALLPPQGRPVCWLVVLILVWITNRRCSRAIPAIGPRHLVERHQFLTLLGLASLSTILVGATSTITVAVAAAAASAMLTAISMWVLYDRNSGPTVDYLQVRTAGQRHQFVAGPYAGVHLVVLGSIIALCYSTTEAISAMTENSWRHPMSALAATTLAAAIILYLSALSWWRRTLSGTIPSHMVAGACLTAVFIPAAPHLPSIITTILATLILAAVVMLGRTPTRPLATPRSLEPC